MSKGTGLGSTIYSEKKTNQATKKFYMLRKETSGHLGPKSDFVLELMNNSKGQTDIQVAKCGVDLSLPSAATVGKPLLWMTSAIPETPNAGRKTGNLSKYTPEMMSYSKVI